MEPSLELSREEIKKNKQRVRARETMARLRKQNPELAREKTRKSMAKWRENPENIKISRKRSSEWREKNPDYNKNYYQNIQKEKNSERRESRRLQKDLQILSEILGPSSSENVDLDNSVLVGKRKLEGGFKKKTRKRRARK